MYFFNIKDLIADLKANKVSQRDGKIYIILLAVIFLVPILLLFNNWITVLGLSKITLMVIRIVIYITALLIFFNYNGLTITNCAQFYKNRSTLVKFASIYVVTTLRWLRYLLLIGMIICIVMATLSLLITGGYGFTSHGLRFQIFELLTTFVYEVTLLVSKFFLLGPLFYPDGLFISVFVSVFLQAQFFWMFINALQQLADIKSAANKRI